MKKERVLLLSFFIFLLLGSCNTTFKKPSLRKINTRTYRVGMPFISSSVGVYEEKGKEYLYFGNIASFKKVKFFTVEGKPSHEIPLKPFFSGYPVTRFFLLNKDTLVLFTQYHNYLAFINNKGEVYKKISLPLLLNKGADSCNYECHASYAMNLKIKNGLLPLHIEKRMDSLNLEWSSQLEMEKYWAHKNWNSPYLVLLSGINTENIQYKFGFYLHKTLFPDYVPRLYIDPPGYTVTDDRMFVFSSYSNKIFTLSLPELTMTDSVSVTLPSYPVGVQPMLLTEENLSKIDSFLMNAFRQENSIANVLYDKYREHHYVVVQIGERWGGDSWVLMIYDKDFKTKIHEHFFSRDEYRPIILVTKEGINVLRNENNGIQEMVFDIFRYSTDSSLEL